MEKPSKEPRRAAIAFILITLFIDIFGIGIIIPVLPELVKGFVSEGAAGKYVGMIAASYAIAQFFFAPVMGALSDRYGRRPILLASMFGLGVDFLIQGFAPNIGWLIGGRIFAGMMGASITTANAYIADVSTPETRARNYGWVGVMFGLAFILGPALGGILGGIHLRLPFFVAAGLSLINWLYGYFILPESHPIEKRGTISIFRLSPLGAFERIRAYGLIAGLSVAFAFMSLAQRGLESVWVLYTGERYGWDVKLNGWGLALVGLTAAIVQGGMVRPIIRRIGERNAVLMGLCVSSVAFWGYGLATDGWMIPVIIIFGSIGGVTGPAIQSLVAGTIDSSQQGKVQAALTSIVSLTNIFAPLIFTYGLFSYFTEGESGYHLPGAPFFVGAILLMIATAVAFRVFTVIPADSHDLTDAKENSVEKSGVSADEPTGA